MRTQRRQTYASRVDFDSFTILGVYFDQKNFMGSLQPKWKAASVWSFNIYNKLAAG